MITYDHRLASAAEMHGIPVLSLAKICIYWVAQVGRSG
jgi:hypothetical protein